MGDGRATSPEQSRKTSTPISVASADVNFSKRCLIARSFRETDRRLRWQNRTCGRRNGRKRQHPETSTLLSAESIRKLFFCCPASTRGPKGWPAQFSALSLRMLSKRILSAPTLFLLDSATPTSLASTLLRASNLRPTRMKAAFTAFRERK